MEATEKSPVNLTILHEEFAVRATQLAGTDVVVFDVWERSDAKGSHYTVTTIHGYDGWWGRLYTRALTPELAAMPYDDERTAAVRAYHQELRDKAAEIIIAAFPDVFEPGFPGAKDGNASCFTWDLVKAEEEPECEGHPAGPDDPMGETVYCDGSCKAVA